MAGAEVGAAAGVEAGVEAGASEEDSAGGASDIGRDLDTQGWDTRVMDTAIRDTGTLVMDILTQHTPTYISQIE